jgi:hypothetical protein
MTFRSTALGTLAIATIAGAASASVTTIDPFVGEAWELYENIGAPGGTPGPARIFDDGATTFDQNANFLMIANSLFSFISETQILPYNGNLMGGYVTGQAVIEFDAPVSEFGGYFGTADVLEGSTINLYDVEGSLISTEPMTFDLGEWNWHGWSSEVPISRVEIHGSATPGLPIVLDDLQVTYAIPAPATGALLGLAGLVAVRRRRA